MAHLFDALARQLAGRPLTRRTLVGTGLAAIATVTTGSLCDKNPTGPKDGCGGGCKSGYGCCYKSGLCCPGSTPHYCANTNRCYQYFTEAQNACGSSYEICGTE